MTGRRSGPVELIGVTDVATAFGLPLLTAVSWFVPARLWPRLGRWFSPFYQRSLSGEPLSSAVTRLERLVAGTSIDGALDTVLRDVVADDIVSLFELLRDYRPGGWKPEIDLSGREHVEAALGQGRGAILWVAHFVPAKLVAKMALNRAGYAVSHLSHPSHGFSATRFGMRCLNRVQTAIECRYLGERVVMSLDSAAGALQVLEQRLAANGVVSISVRGKAQGAPSLPFLKGEIGLAAGAPSLAHRSGAALLPVFPLRNASGGFTVFVEPPLDIDRSLGRREASAAALRQYVGLLERYVLAYPGQWLGWFHL